MFEIDRDSFGSFVAGLRKEKGFTQKELAARLFVSDKAVSKWESGRSLPDVSLLVPLSESLGVTVTELLECRRMEKAAMEPGEVEELVKKTISLSAEEEKRRRPGKKEILAYALCLLAAAAETAALLALGVTAGELASCVFVFIGLGAGFGAYFFFFVKEKLPAYYDGNKIDYYSDGPLRLNLPGVHFNNRNWPHVVRAARFGTMLMAVGSPAVFAFFRFCFPELSASAVLVVPMLILTFSALFLPIYIAAKKWE
ncbi:MAG: helix-turn-helix domain-containing protein [Oscillospiraceae bacterium]